jgi:hypothetical protein
VTNIVTRRTFRNIIWSAAASTILATGHSTSLGTGAVSVDAQDVVEIRLRGRYFSEPANVRITVAVEPDADNRVLRIEADGDRLFRSSQVTLSGARDRRLHTVEFKNLPAGSYTVRAQVLSNVEVRGAAEDRLIVAGVGSEP